MEYKLKTIQDIFDKVPAEKILVCMNELATALHQAAAMRDLLTSIAIEAGVDESTTSCGVKLPEFFTWIDDDKGCVDLTFTVNGEKMLQTKTVVDSGT